ncbi:MAG: hypothetical protein K2K24_03240, partial [Clostridia bacterium]|nr:hypothetical protein [Clostridia bacterium]
LWHTGVDESVARRILFSLNKVEDPREMRLRKIYLAHFYSEREDYRLATNLCRQILMEGGMDKEVLLLMQYCCLKRGDIMGVGEVFGFVKEMSEEDRTSFMENFDAEEIPPSMLVDTSQRKKGTKVEYKDGWVEYYDKGKLVYKFFDNDYFAFMKDNSARRMLGAGDPIGAVAQLDAVKFDHVRHSTILLCEQTYVNAFLELGEHLNAFSHCKVFIDKNMYIDAMLPLLDGLRKDGCDLQFEELRRFVGSLKGYEINQLTSFFDYSDETGDYTFWEMLEKSNPLEKLPESDERLCLQGRACDRNGDFESAERYWRKAIAIYGQFSSANYYLNYPEILSQVEDKDEIETSDLMDGFKEIFINDMGNWKNKDDLRDNADKKATQLNIALCDLYIDLG